MAVQPKRGAALSRHFDEFLKIVQAVRAPLALAAGHADGEMGDKDAWAGLQFGQEPGQTLALRRPSRAAGVQGQAITGGRVDTDEPDIADALRERVYLAVHALAHEPRGEAALEIARDRGRHGAIIVIARDRHAGQLMDTQDLG